MRDYTVLHRDGQRQTVTADWMQPAGAMVEFWRTETVVGVPRPVLVLRVAASAVARVERDDGEVWER